MIRVRSTALMLASLGWALPSILAAQEEGGAGAQLVSVDLGLTIWTIVVFLGLLALLWKFAWGPILGAVADREQRIQSSLDDAAARQAEAARLLQEHKAQLADARRQTQEIIAEGKAAGERIRREVEEKARAESANILERARQDIGREKDAALAELRRESVDLALAAAERLIDQKLDAEKDRELVLGYIRELSKGSDGGARA